MSLPSQADLTDIAGFFPWLVERDWTSKFDDASMQRASDCRVPTIKIIENPGGRSLLRITAKVVAADRGEQRTNLDLTPALNPRTRTTLFLMKAECSCSKNRACQHAAAVLETLRSIASSTPVPGATQMSPALVEWLGKIRKAEKAASSATVLPQDSGHFIAYCIEPASQFFQSPQESLYFSVRTGIERPEGVFIDTKTVNTDPSRSPKQMTAEDLAICARINQRNRSLRVWGGSVPLEGAGWQQILTAILATGRLFYSNTPANEFPPPQFKRVSEGPTVELKPEWEPDADGGAKPVIKLPSPTMRLLGTEPLFYLDATNLLLGRIESTHSSAFMLAWGEGPVVPAATIPTLNSELATIIPDNPLPLPAEKPPKILRGLLPVPSLHITNVLVGIFLKRHIGGVLRFQYPGSPLLFPLAADAPAKTSWIDGDTRIILERDRDAENALAAKLTERGLTPLHRIIPAEDLNDKNRQSVVLQHPTTRVSDWLEFLESPDCKALVANGWSIDADAKLGLTIHDIRDFFPALEKESDKGIDWFRFDVVGEFEGKRVSLIPQIAKAISEDWHLRYPEEESVPENLLLPCEKQSDGHIRFPARRFLEMLDQVRHLFQSDSAGAGPIKLDRLGAACIADALEIQSTDTTASLAELGRNLRDIHGLPATPVPQSIRAELRHYQVDGFRWLQFLADHGLHGILADDMGLGKTLQTLAHLCAQKTKSPDKPSLVIAPTSVVPNWAAEAERHAPDLKVLVLHGGDRADNFDRISEVDLVLTSYPLLVRDFAELSTRKWNTVVLDEAQYIKNSKAQTAISACSLRAEHRVCLSGTPMENHLGELWSLMRFLMPGFLTDEKNFNTNIRKPIERDQSEKAQLALNRRISPLILRRTKDQVATELPEKTTLIHGIDLTAKQTDLYESVRAAMDERVREAITSKGLAKSHIIVLDALLKLRQICCHPQLLKSEAAQRVMESAKLEYLTEDLLPTLLEEGRRILLFSQFTSMLDLIEEHLKLERIPFLKLTGQTKERANLVKQFQTGTIPVFLISLKAGGTGLNLTAADTVIHYDPWWNPAAENQATDRAHRIGQTKPVFVHKLVCRGTIEDRILDLQKHKAALVEALLSEETTKLKIDAETLSQLLAPLE